MMNYKIEFNTKEEADNFKTFLNMKAVKYAIIQDKKLVIITSIILDQDWYNLLIQFGKWTANSKAVVKHINEITLEGDDEFTKQFNLCSHYWLKSIDPELSKPEREEFADLWLAERQRLELGIR